MGDILSMLKALLGFGPSDPAENLTPQEAYTNLNAPTPPQLVDVRSEEEYKQGHIDGSKLIPLQELGKRTGEIKTDQPVILYCHSGTRSGLALRLLKGTGFTRVAHIKGGIMAWRGFSLPIKK